MNVVEKIRERQKSIRESFKSLRSQLTIENIPPIKLSDFAKLDCALEVHSEILDSEIWFCSNEKMANQVKNEKSEPVTYTVDELKHLIKLKPGPEVLRKINKVKEVFNKSKVVNSILKR